MYKGFNTENIECRTESHRAGHQMHPAQWPSVVKLRALCGKKAHLVLLIFITIVSACKSDSSSTAVRFNSPDAGTKLKSGEDLLVDLQFDGSTGDSVIYLIDSVIAGSKADTSDIKLSTKGLALGNHLLTAKVYNSGKPVEITSNVIILAANPPVPYTFKTVNVYPHDTSSYVEGLEYHDGFLYESDGGDANQYGGSSLRLTEIKTGKILKRIDIPNYFAEGITVIDNKIIQFTYTEGLGFVYDKSTFKKLSEFSNTAGAQGWGLAFDGKNILNTDGTSMIHFLNKDTYQKERSIEVYDDKGAVSNLNELEFIDGKIFANVYTKSIILIIDPKTGMVENQIDLSSLLPKDHLGDDNYVLNGIAWDPIGKRLFVTGKLWDKLYEITLIKN